MGAEGNSDVEKEVNGDPKEISPFVEIYCIIFSLHLFSGVEQVIEYIHWANFMVTLFSIILAIGLKLAPFRASCGLQLSYYACYKAPTVKNISYGIRKINHYT